jgi:hypothetical protein
LTIVLSVLLSLLFWPLCCLFFCFFYFGHCVVCTFVSYFGHCVVCIFVSFVLAIVLTVRRFMALVYTILYRQTFLMF